MVLLGTLNAQEKYWIYGSIEANTGNIQLLPIGNESFYPNKSVFNSHKIIRNRFELQIDMSYPYAFKIGLRRTNGFDYISDMFLIQEENQKIICNKDSIWETPIILSINSNKSINKKFNKQIVEFSLLKTITDSALLEYTKKYPNSYLPLWILIDKFTKNGYKFIFSSIFNNLSLNVRSSYSGKILSTKMNNSKKIQVGSIFPNINVYDSKTYFDLSDEIKNNKIYLIDFWYTSCGPCIAQFGALKELYNKFHMRGFEIIGISRSDYKDISSWRSLILKHQLKWKNYIDLNGKICNNFYIELFPTNFLLDSNGKIISRDIDIAELETILMKL